MSYAVRATHRRMGVAAKPLSTTYGSFRFAVISAGPIEFMSRSCRPCVAVQFRCAGQIALSGTRDIPMYALRTRKLERDARILRQELDDRPDDPFVLFNLGSIATEQRDWRALDFLSAVFRGRPRPTRSRASYSRSIPRSHQMLGDSMSALRTCDQGLKYEPADAELWFRKGVVHRQRGEPAEAEICWRRILTLKPPQQFRSVDLGIYGHLTRRNWAALAADRGDHEEAERLWHRILLECPGDREAIEKLRKLEPCENMSAADRFAAP